MSKLISTKKILFMVLAIGLTIYGCDTFLNAPARGSLSEDVLSNQKGVETLLNGAYGALDGQAIVSDRSGATAPSNWVYGSIAGGDAHKGESIGNTAGYVLIGNMQANPSISYLNAKWKALYEGVSRTNAVLKLLPKVNDMDDNTKSEVAAEARFLRGHYYFELKKMFNMVPWIDENTKDLNQPNDTDIWPKIEEDFKFAIDNLPATQSDKGRVNKWAAEAYLAKTYVFQKKWQPAKDLYDEIIMNGVTTQGVPYGLFDNFWDNFNPAKEDGSPEAVFSIEMVANDGTGTTANANLGIRVAFPYNGPFSCCGYYQPTQDLVNSYRTDSNGLPMPDNYDSTPVNNDMQVADDAQFDPYSGSLDPRLDWTVGRRGVPYLDWGPYPGTAWAREPNNFGPYGPKKNVYWHAQQDQYADLNSWAPGTAINYNVIRFADVLLMAAETEAQLGNLEAARNYVNRVRNRSADTTSWVRNDLNKAYAVDVVDNEQDMLNSNAQPGDWVVRTDRNSTFYLLKGDPGDINNWNEYEEPNYVMNTYPGPWSDKNTALKRIYFERKLELAMEGHRFFDLVRWGIAEETLNSFYDYEGPFLNISTRDGHFTPNQDEYYPIPQNQIDLSVVDGKPKLKQNPGYN